MHASCKRRGEARNQSFRTPIHEQSSSMGENTEMAVSQRWKCMDPRSCPHRAAGCLILRARQLDFGSESKSPLLHPLGAQSSWYRIALVVGRGGTVAGERPILVRLWELMRNAPVYARG